MGILKRLDRGDVSRYGLRGEHGDRPIAAVLRGETRAVAFRIGNDHATKARHVPCLYGRRDVKRFRPSLLRLSTYRNFTAI